MGWKLHKRERKSVEWSYDWYTKNKIVNPNLDMTEAQVKAVQDIHVKVGVQQKALPFDQAVDLTAQKRALEILGPYKPKA